MADKDFIIKKLQLMKKDKQPVFDKLAEPLQDMAQDAEPGKVIKIPVDGNWFKVSFDAVEVKSNRLVISANRIENGLRSSAYDPSIKEYRVDFADTRAAYLRGFYEPRHPVFGWSYIYWDVRAYANHPSNPAVRVYVSGFRARDEIKKMIVALEGIYGASNILNSYINDNFKRFQAGIKQGKSPQKIEKEWSCGLMESLGYGHVEAFDDGYPKGKWTKIKVHWCKLKHDLRG